VREAVTHKRGVDEAMRSNCPTAPYIWVARARKKSFGFEDYYWAPLTGNGPVRGAPSRVTAP